MKNNVTRFFAVALSGMALVVGCGKNGADTSVGHVAVGPGLSSTAHRTHYLDSALGGNPAAPVEQQGTTPALVRLQLNLTISNELKTAFNSAVAALTTAEETYLQSPAFVQARTAALAAIQAAPEAQREALADQKEEELQRLVTEATKTQTTAVNTAAAAILTAIRPTLAQQAWWRQGTHVETASRANVISFLFFPSAPTRQNPVEPYAALSVSTRVAPAR